LSLMAFSVGIGLSSGLSSMLLAMALACEPKTGQTEQELTDDYRGSSRDRVSLSGRTRGSSPTGAGATGVDNIHVTALLSGQSASAIFVICVWMAVKATGQNFAHYAEMRTTVLNGGRLELMLAAFGCFVGAYACARLCAGRFDSSSKTESDPEAEHGLMLQLRPFALALMLNSICSTVLFPRLLDSAPSKYGTSPDWLASDLSLLYSVADLAGRIFSGNFFDFLQGLSSTVCRNACAQLQPCQCRLIPCCCRRAGVSRLAVQSRAACDGLGCNHARRQPVPPYSFSTCVRVARRLFAHSLRLSDGPNQWALVRGLHADRRSSGQKCGARRERYRDEPTLGYGKCLWGWGGSWVFNRLHHFFQRLGLSLSRCFGETLNENHTQWFFFRPVTTQSR